MEALLLQHPNVVDAAVVGVYSEKDATELPRFVPSATPSNSPPSSCPNPSFHHFFSSRAHVVPKVKPKPGAESAAFSKEIQDWVRGRVAPHKFLRGGVVIIDQVPKSTAGKILRKQLRDPPKADSLTML